MKPELIIVKTQLYAVLSSDGIMPAHVLFLRVANSGCDVLAEWLQKHQYDQVGTDVTAYAKLVAEVGVWCLSSNELYGIARMYDLHVHKSWTKQKLVRVIRMLPYDTILTVLEDYGYGAIDQLSS